MSGQYTVEEIKENGESKNPQQWGVYDSSGNLVFTGTKEEAEAEAEKLNEGPAPDDEPTGPTGRTGPTPKP